MAEETLEGLVDGAAERRPARLTPGWIAAFYVVAGLLWFTFYDPALRSLLDNPERVAELQPFKAGGFIAVMAVLVYFLARRLVAGMERELAQRKRDQAALLTREARFREMAEVAPMGIVIFRVSDGVFLYANDAMERMFGYGPGELLGVSSEQLYVNPESGPPLLDEISAWGLVVNHEVEARRNDGSRLWVMVSMRSISFDDSDSALSVFTDITERKDAEMALKERESTLDSLFRAAPIGIGVVQDRVFRRVNDRICNTVGYSSEELIGSSARLLYAGDEEFERVGAEQAAQISESGIATVETSLRGKDGRVVDVLVSTTYLDGSNPAAGLLFTAQDISRYRRAQEEMRRSEERFRNLVESTSDWVWEVDCHGVYTYVSPRVEEVLGYRVEEVIGMTPFDLTSPGEATAMAERFRTVAEARAPIVNLENRAVHKEGHEVILETSGVPFFSADGALLGYRGIDRDVGERRRAQRALLENEQRFRRYFEIGLIGIAETSPEMGWIRVNDQLCEMLGYTHEELAAVTWADLTHPDDLAADLDHFGRVVAGEAEGYSLEKRFVRKDGIAVPTIVSVRCKRKDDGRADYLVAFLQDISDLKVTEIRLRESQRMLRLVLDSIPVRVFWKDRDLAYLGCNRQFVQDAGLGSAEELIGKSDLELAWAEHAESYRAHDRLVIQSGASKLNYEECLTDGYGNRRWLRTNKIPLPGPDGRTMGVLGCYEDITERKQAEQALRQSEQRFRRYFEISLIGVAETSPDKSWIKVNHQLCDMLGYTEEDLRRTTWIDLTHPDDLEAEQVQFQRLLSGQIDGYSLEKRFVRQDGRMVPTIVSMRCQRHGDGSPEYMVAFVQDITERKQAEEDIRSLNEQLEQRIQDRTADLEAANREMEAFTYSVSHDLRAPLRALDGFSAAVMEDYGERLDAEGKRYLRYIEEAGREMNALVDGLLRLSRSTRGELVRVPVNLSALVEAALAASREAEPHREVSSAVQPRVYAYGDPRLLKTVVENLVGNAWKYTGKTPNPHIEFEVEERTQQKIYSLRDNGAGFDMAYAHKLFLPFQRLHRVDEFEGTGIGLATVQRIIQRHGGKIWAEAKVGTGATLYFTLRTGARRRRKGR